MILNQNLEKKGNCNDSFNSKNESNEAIVSEMSNVTLISPVAADQKAYDRPKRVAAVKSKRVIEDNIDDSDDDPHFEVEQSHDEESSSNSPSDGEQPEKKTKVTSKQIYIILCKFRTIF